MVRTLICLIQSFERSKLITIAIAFLFIVGASAGRIPNAERQWNGACRRAQGQFFSETTLSCESCLKFCQIGKYTSSCPQQCDAFMIRMEMENMEKSEGDKKAPQEHRVPPLVYLAIVLVLVVPGLIAVFVAKRRNSQSTALISTLHNVRPNQTARHEEVHLFVSGSAPPTTQTNRTEYNTQGSALIPNLHNSPPNQTAQHDGPNLVDRNCAMPATTADHMEHPTSQDTKRPERAFVQDSDSREESDYAEAMMKSDDITEEAINLALS